MIDISTLGNNVFKSPCDADSFLIVLFAACVVVVQCHVMRRSHVLASSVHPQLSAKICHTKYTQHNAELQIHSTLSKSNGAEVWQGMFCISKFTNYENSNM